jgi:L-ascorbate metabolism protein UlaG (beta-lactamase superfamily)
MIQAGGKKVLVDALFDKGFGTYLAHSQELLTRMTGAQEPFGSVDLLLITHPHPDHFDPKMVVEFLRNHVRCRLIAHTQTVDQLRKEEGFAQIREQIHEVRLEPGSRESMTISGIALDVLVLAHMLYYQDGRNLHEETRNLAFIVNLGGTRFLHMGDATVENNLAHLNAHPFERAPVDILFLNRNDRSEATQQFIADKIKPSQIVAMNIPSAELAEETNKILAVYPHAIVFKESMERRSIPISVDFHNLTGDYFGQRPPGATPQIFARGIVSTGDQAHSAPSSSPGGNEVLWLTIQRRGEKQIPVVMTMRRENGRWSVPQATAFGGMALFSPNGRRVYFSAPRPDATSNSPEDIWFAEKQGSGWGSATCLGFTTRWPELRFASGPTISSNGAIYFMAYLAGARFNIGIYRSEMVNGEYAKPEPLPSSINLIPALNWTPFVAPDESFLLFSSNRPGSLDPNGSGGWPGGDLYISRRRADGSWTEPSNLGKPVNSTAQERLPGISPDGKYLFFTRPTPGFDEDVYWVETASIPALRPPQDNPK